MARVAAVDQQATSDLNWRKGSERSCEKLLGPQDPTFESRSPMCCRDALRQRRYSPAKQLLEQALGILEFASSLLVGKGGKEEKNHSELM